MMPSDLSRLEWVSWGTTSVKECVVEMGIVHGIMNSLIQGTKTNRRKLTGRQKHMPVLGPTKHDKEMVTQPRHFD